MRFRYIPNTVEDQKEMLTEIGVESVEDLFADIPSAVRFKGNLNLPKAMSEHEITTYMSKLAAKNVSLNDCSSFLGAGVYQHFIPSVVNHVISRSEFYTAYTPYQPEISQGELQGIFEFQSLIAELTGMEAANSSMYDGATSLAEAATMAAGSTRRNKILVSLAVHPEARAVLKTYARGQNLEVVEVNIKDGKTDLEELKETIDAQTAAVIIQYPNFFGLIEDVLPIEEVTHQNKSLFIVSANPMALPILKAPGEFRADIVVGDNQPMGIPTSFGGPHVGFFATSSKLIRKMPGRIVGQTTDDQGNRGFVLTLQAREQHIRREKATSNICSNQALVALASAVYMNAMGKQGIQEVAKQNLQKAHYAYQVLTRIKGVEPLFEGNFFNEFAIKLPKPVSKINEELLKHNIIGGYDLSKDYPTLKNAMLIAVTEIKSKEEIDEFAARLEGLL
ncbi:glycine dehydrogenase (aminomethyl-transferring) [Vulcanibacillus modesticaldus]|uniref:Probable glycine dehydrogenase (decarboxylating) subunit 1 n=1 Tax=Vulcanibacillus modesticaldus TaxID=337097 RepID=A0A1D2YVH1_9BACI|nr:aminomethyl-transferring glycine dehydrogenase subunit GcvPA [Vulcanibacillus modesticaldus]OEF99616.1 glycine dehydrogenase (aminomethyl-transferring) [Vulcanibacillus modesticaldus]